MTIDDETSRVLDWYRCTCGIFVELTLEQFERREAYCPACGAEIDLGQAEEWSSDTQMLNLEDMARMAQEGVGVASSGEWDTRELTGEETVSRPDRPTRRRKSSGKDQT
jgi:hypothetical protein